MSILNDILTETVALAQETSPYATIMIGSLPADNGITMTYGASGVNTTFQTKTICYDLDVVLNGKHSNQQTVSDTLNEIHKALTQRKTYPETEDFKIADISTTSAPSYLDREENNQWLYGSSLRVRAYVINS